MPVYVIDTLKPKNGLDFPVVEAIDVAVEGYLNLADAVTHFATDTAIAAINSALSNKANTSDITNLQGQIDQIVISASAESVVAPEVAAARVDEDGVTYTTLKSRMDSDISWIREGMQNATAIGALRSANARYLESGKNKFDGVYVRGALVEEDETLKLTYGSSELLKLAIVPIKPNTTYTISKYSNSTRKRYATMSAFPIIKPNFKVPVDRVLFNDDTADNSPVTFTSTSTEKYLLLFVSNANQEPTMQVEEGSTSTAYEVHKLKFKHAIADEEVVTSRTDLEGVDRSTLDDRLDADYSYLKNGIKSFNAVDFGVIRGSNTNFLECGKNKFDGVYVRGALIAEEDETLNLSYGSSANNRLAVVSIEPNTTYTISKYTASDRKRYALMSEFPVIKQGYTQPVSTVILNNDAHRGTVTFTSGADEKYLVMYISNSAQTPQMQVEEGSEGTDYEEYKVFLKGQGEVEQKEQTATREKVSCYDERLWRFGYLNSTTGAYVYENEQRITTPNYILDSVVEMNAADDYTMLLFAWDSENQYVGRWIGDGFSNSLEDSAVYVQHINFAELRTTYTGYKFKVTVKKGNNLYMTYMDVAKAITFLTDTSVYTEIKKKPFFFDDVNVLYNCPADVDGGSVDDTINLVETDATTILDLYDDLVEQVGYYVSKTQLGTVSGYPINAYTFNQPTIQNSSPFGLKKAKIIVCAGIHGYEQGAVWCLYQLFNYLCNTSKSSDPAVKFLRNNVQFIVVPIVNPYGFSHNQRQNENGVDLNRNFDAGWTYNGSSVDHSTGESPASEEETQIIQALIDANTDADYLIDYHNIASGNPLYYLNCEDQVKMCNAVFTTLTDKWVGDYPNAGFWYNQQAGYCDQGSQATMVRYAIRDGVDAVTLETPWIMPRCGTKQYDQNTIRTGVDTLGNTLIAICKHLKEKV